MNKDCFQRDMAHGNFKFLHSRTVSEGYIAFNIAKNPKYDGYQKRLASMT